MKPILFAGLVSMAFLFCTNGPAERVASHDFYIRFLQDEAKLLAQVSFKAGESAEKMSPQLMPTVHFQGESMTLQTGPTMIRYQMNQSGGFQTEYKFDWKNDAGATGKYAMRIAPILNFTLPPAPWPTGAEQNVLLRWDGPPLGRNEKLIVLAEPENGGETVRKEFDGPTDLSAVPLPAASFSAGKWSFYVVKTLSEKKTEGSVTTTSLFEFYSNTQKIELK